MTTTAETRLYPDLAPPTGAAPDVWKDSTSIRRRDVYTRCVLSSTDDPLWPPVVTAEVVQWTNGAIGPR